MDNKMTRRVALGGIIGALAAGPFVMRAWRQPKDLPEMDRAQLEREVAMQKAAENSGLPVSEVKKALEIFEENKAKWAKFRGVEADVQLTLEGESPTSNGWVKLTEEGAISLVITDTGRIWEDSMDDAIPNAIEDTKVWHSELKYFDPNREKERWSLKLDIDDTSKQEFVGERSEISDFWTVYEALTSSFNLFAAPWTEYTWLFLALDNWRVQTDESKNTAKNFILSEKNRGAQQAQILPKLTFRDRLFYAIETIDHEKTARTIEAKQYAATQKELEFPSVLITKIDRPKDKTKAILSMQLTNMRVATV